MYAKVFKRGTGKSGGIDYLLSELDAGKNPRSVLAKVLRGDPELTKSLIDAADFNQRYTSGVLSFTEQDLPDKIKQEIIDSFEKEAMVPGLTGDQYNTLWVEHKDKNRLELHFVVPNVELTTGKRLATYYHPADMPRWDNWQEVKNFDYHLTSPKEPKRKQTITLSKNLPQNKSAALKEINSNIEYMIQMGIIDNRDDVIQILEGAGLEIVRVTEKSISIKNPTDGKQNIRLKGAYYEQSFTSRDQLAGDFQKTRDDYQRDLRKNIDRAREKLADQIKRKIEYHRERYSQAPATLGTETEREPDRSLDEIQRDIEGDREQAKANRARAHKSLKESQARLVEAVSDRNYPLGGNRGGERGGDPLFLDRNHDITPTADGVTETDHEATKGRKNLDQPGEREAAKNLRSETPTMRRDRPRRREIRHRRDIHGHQGALNDRARNPLVERLEEFGAAIQRATESIRAGAKCLASDVRAYFTRERELAPANQQLEQTGRELTGASQQLERSGRQIERVMQERALKLARELALEQERQRERAEREERERLARDQGDGGWSIADDLYDDLGR